jgi:hypothetical protein
MVPDLGAMTLLSMARLASGRQRVTNTKATLPRADTLCEFCRFQGVDGVVFVCSDGFWYASRGHKRNVSQRRHCLGVLWI